MNEISIHLLLLGAVLMVVGAFRTFAVKLGQPLVIGEIVAGLLLGSLLSILCITGEINVLENNMTIALSVLGDIGLAFIILGSLFHQSTTTQIDTDHFKRILIITMCNIIPSFVAGAGFAIIYLQYNTSCAPVSFILLTATSVSVSAVPVLSRILVELKLENSVLGSTLFRSACWTDTIAWSIVGAILSINTGAGVINFALERFSIIIILLSILICLRKHFAYYFSTSSSVSKTILIILLLSAGITQLCSLHLVFGAFLVGITFCSNENITANWTKDSLWITEKFFSPIFFVVTGINAVSNQNISLQHLGWGLIFLVISMVSKIIPLYFGARNVGFSNEDSKLISVLLNTRGLMEIAILSVGLKAKIYKTEQFTIFIIVALSTTIICVPLCKYILNKNKSQEIKVGETIL